MILMTDITKILLTTSLTLLGGVSLFIIGQLIGKFVIDQIHCLKKVLADIRYSLAFHSQTIHTPVGNKESEDRASEALLRLSCDLLASVDAIPRYQLLSLIFHNFLPSRANVLAASRQLRSLSNSVHKDDRSTNCNIVKNIEHLLGFESLE
jgi:hypothetical protein